MLLYLQLYSTLQYQCKSWANESEQCRMQTKNCVVPYQASKFPEWYGHRLQNVSQVGNRYHQTRFIINRRKLNFLGSTIHFHANAGRAVIVSILNERIHCFYYVGNRMTETWFKIVVIFGFDNSLSWNKNVPSVTFWYIEGYEISYCDLLLTFLEVGLEVRERTQNIIRKQFGGWVWDQLYCEGIHSQMILIIFFS